MTHICRPEVADLSNLMSHKLFLIRYESFDKGEIHRSLASHRYNSCHKTRVLWFIVYKSWNWYIGRFRSWVISDILWLIENIHRPLSVKMSAVLAQHRSLWLDHRPLSATTAAFGWSWTRCLCWVQNEILFEKHFFTIPYLFHAFFKNPLSTDLKSV